MILRTGALVGYIQQSSSRNLRALKVYSAEPLFSRALDWIFWAYSKPLQYSTMQEVIQLNCRPAGLAFSNFCSTSLSSEKTLQEHKDASILASQALTGRLRWLWSQLSSQSPLHLRTLMSCQWRQIKLTQTHFKRRMPNPQRQEVHTFTHKKTHTHSFPLSLSLCLSLSCCLCVSSTHSCWQLSSALPLLLFLQYCCACKQQTNYSAAIRSKVRSVYRKNPLSIYLRMQYTVFAGPLQPGR